MSLRPDLLPDPQTYYPSHGFILQGRTTWRTTACPFHGGSDSMRVNLATGGFICMACGERGGDVLDFHAKAFGMAVGEAARELGAWSDSPNPPQRALRPAPARDVQHLYPNGLAPWAQRWWDDSQPIAGEALEYLLARRCVVPPPDGDLRWHPELPHGSGYVGPALVALVTHAITRKPMTLHRTWITPTGRKADLEEPRLFLGRHPKKFGVVRLWPDDAVDSHLGIAEGIETALTLARVLGPTWCCLDAPNLTELPPLAGIEVLTIAVDHDPAGIKAAHACATAWTERGTTVRQVMSPVPGHDLNDMAMEDLGHE